MEAMGWPFSSATDHRGTSHSLCRSPGLQLPAGGGKMRTGGHDGG